MADLTGDSSVTYTALTVTGDGLTGLPGYSSFSTTYYLLEASGDGQINSVGLSYEHLPYLKAVGTMEPPVPILVLENTESVGIPGKLGLSDARLPEIDAESAGSTARISASAVSVLIAQGDGTGLCQRLGVSSLSLKTLDDASTGYSNRLAESSQAIAMLATASTGASGGAEGSMQSLPIVEFESTGMTSRVGTAVLTLLPIAGDGAGTGSSISMSEIELPMWTGTGQGGGLAGVSILELPAWIVFGAGANNATVTAGTAAQGTSYAMHTQTRALVQDSNNHFNSYATHGSVILAANEDGLYVLGGATDAGVKINSSMVLPVSDLEDARLKRIAQLTVGYRADGRMLLTLLTDDGQTVSYTMELVTGAKCQPNRVKVGRGSKSRYWEFQIDNINGCDHAIDKIDVDWQILSRRVP